MIPKTTIKTPGGLASLGTDRGMEEVVVKGKAALRVTDFSDRMGILKDVADYYGLDFDGDVMVSDIRAPRDWGKERRPAADISFGTLCGTCGKPLHPKQEMIRDKAKVQHHPKCLTGRPGYMLSDKKLASITGLAADQTGEEE